AVNEHFETEVLTRSSHSSRTSYAALLEAHEADTIILDTYGETVTLKRRRDDDLDKDEGPSARPDRGSKRQREGKETESASAPSEPTTRIVGVEDQPIVQSSQHPKWFSQPQKPPTLDRDWNKTLPAVYRSIQLWITELAKVDTLTPELLVGPTYKLMKGLCKSLIELEYHLEEVYKAITDQLDWVNPEDYRHIKWIEDLVPRTMWIQEPIDYDKHALWGRRIIAFTELKIVEWHSYKHLHWITVRRDDDKFYKFKEGDFKRLRLQGKLTNLTVEERFTFNVSLRMFTRSIVIQRRVEDLQLGVKSYQKKLNLTKPDTYQADLKHKEAYIAYSNP
nr:hypothetical protein [Tanacetum cinerariifolium]